jgi:hypothetical protein
MALSLGVRFCVLKCRAGGSHAGLCSAIDEMRCREPGVTRKRFKASDSVETSNRLVCTHRSAGYRTEYHCAVGPLQLAKCFRAVFKPGHRWLDGRASCGNFFLPIERLDRGSLLRGAWQSAHFTGYQDGVSHRFRAQLRSARIFRPAWRRPKFVFLASDLGQTGRLVKRMQCTRESLLLILRFGWAARLRHELPRLAQRFAGLCY